jgi:GTP-binding protein
MQARFIKSAAGAEGFPDDSGREVAFVGRSNSGKSSAINRITGQSGLARVSKTPGRTQLVNFFELGSGQRLVDLPGYGFARVPDAVRAEWRGLVDAYFRARQSLAGLFLTVDIRRGLNDGDRQMLAWAAEIECPVVVLLTKSDKLSRGAGTNRSLEVERELAGLAEVVCFSAPKGTGVEAVRRLVQARLEPSAP